MYGEKVSLYSVTKEKIPFFILIESKQINKSFKEYFEWLWKVS
jgi:hypothetical protein